MNKVKITGIKNLPFEGTFETNKDYLVSIIAALESIEKFPSQGEEEPEYIYKLKANHVELVQEVGGQQIKVQKGFSKSQVQRLKIKEYLERTGQEYNTENYNKIMDKLFDLIDSWEA